MNIFYIIGLVLSIVFILLGMLGFPAIDMNKLMNFVDGPSAMIVVGCTIGVLVASVPFSTLKSLPKHFGIVMNTKRFQPDTYIDQLTELANRARRDGLLSLEGAAAEQTDPFFKQAIMLLVDGTDGDRVREILVNDIEQMSARHDAGAAMYEKGSALAPAFGMVGTLCGLINMCKGLNMDDGSSNIGNDMGVAMITTLYGCIVAHMIFGPLASHLRAQDEEECLCKMIIVEGVTGIQAGENPKFLRERLLTFVSQKKRAAAGSGGGGE
ncbi:MAG: MotA/TolQ/ExbB proton channel family protein [Oscillospiraceae bacterium]|nr:MotA/TolQ/ExbB proton channel family protein [Oscillospiraceae bacterium]